MNLLVDPIKADLGISDTQMSLLLGFSYAVFSAMAGIPIARLADVHSRRLIIGIGIVGWSTMTAACGLAQNYWQLFLARVGTGIGEAANGPATFSLLSDLFPKKRLPRAIAVLQLGYVAGQGLALIAGGAAFAWLVGLESLVLPVVGELRPWQATFLVVGLPGVALAFLMATVKEPRRHGRLAASPVSREGSIPLRELAGFLHANRRTYYPLFAGMALINELYQPSIGIVPIGDRFTMGARSAAFACKKFFQFSTVLPCHYGTFPGMLDETADAFVAEMEGENVLVPRVGESVTV